MENNILEKGPHSTNARAAIMIGSENSWQKPTELTFVNNSFINVGSATTAFVLNWSGVAPRLEGNRLRGQVVLLSDDGLWVHRLRECLGWVKARLLADGPPDERHDSRHVIASGQGVPTGPCPGPSRGRGARSTCWRTGSVWLRQRGYCPAPCRSWFRSGVIR